MKNKNLANCFYFGCLSLVCLMSLGFQIDETQAGQCFSFNEPKQIEDPLENSPLNPDLDQSFEDNVEKAQFDDWAKLRLALRYACGEGTNVNLQKARRLAELVVENNPRRWNGDYWETPALRTAALSVIKIVKGIEVTES